MRRMRSSSYSGLSLEPRGIGTNIERPQGSISGIIEEKDASPEQRDIHEINGYNCRARCFLEELILQIDNENSRGSTISDVVGGLSTRSPW